MSVRWFVVKHVPDLVRREPKNIGVILFVGNAPMSRFVGEQEDGEIDGRSVVQFGNHLVYKAWVRQWRSLRDQGVDALLDQVHAGRAPGASFYIEDGGEQIFGDDGGAQDEILDDLYSTLVRPDAEPADADDVRGMTRSVLRKVGLWRHVQERARLEVTVNGVPDDLWFDYRYDNGRPHLMQRIGLATSDKSTWDRLHLIETNFERLALSKALPDFNAITFMKQRDADPRLIEAATGRLAPLTAIIDVSDQEAAAERLEDLLHIRPSTH
jgi:hypothetical protein